MKIEVYCSLEHVKISEYIIHCSFNKIIVYQQKRRFANFPNDYPFLKNRVLGDCLK